MSGIMSMLLGAVSSAAAAVDEFFNRVTLLLPGNGTNGAQNNTFLDSSTNNFTITRNGNTTQGTFSPFSQTGWSNYFDGTGDFFTAPGNTALNIGGDTTWTIEFWGYVGAAFGTYSPMSMNQNGTIRWGLEIGASATNVVFSNAAAVSFTHPSTLATNTWFHFALVRDGTTVRLYINGVASSTTSTNNLSSVDSSTSLFIGRNNVAGFTFDWNGYMSNVRMVKGTAVYTSAFTPSTTPLTAITNTSLLTCQSNRFVDNSSNGFTLTANGTPSVQAFSPFLPTAAYSAATVGGSGYFDGTGDQLVAPSNTALAMGTGDFQIEFWAYHTSIPAGFTYIDTRPTGTNGSYITLGYNNSGNGIFLYVNTMLISTGITPVANSWTHFVLSRVGSTTRLFRNGSQIGSATDGTNYAIGAQGMGIGANTIAAENYFPGYISEFRVVKGSGVTSVTVPTAPLTAITNTTLLLNFTNAGITDATAKNDLETVGNAQISTTQSKFGGSSMSFDGTGDYLFSPQSNNPQNLNWELVRGDFTIEFWFRANTVAPTVQGLIVKFDGDANSRSEIQYMINLGGSSLNCNAYQGGANNDITFTSAISANTWYHVAFVRSGNSFYAYLDGTRNATIRTITGDLNSGTNWPLYIGSYTEGGVNYAFNGFIDDLRITKFARYSGATITAPTSAFALQ